MSENVFPLAFAYIQMLILSEISPNKHTLSLHCSAPQNAQTCYARDVSVTILAPFTRPHVFPNLVLLQFSTP